MVPAVYITLVHLAAEQGLSCPEVTSRALEGVLRLYQSCRSWGPTGAAITRGCWYHRHIMAITVHHLMHSRSLRVLWLLEELGLEYELVRYERDANFRAPPSLEKAHPLGRAPVVEVDGLVLAESGAILEHFADRERRLRPTSPEGLREYRFFLHYAEGSAMPPLLVQLLVERVRSAPMPFLVKPIARRIADEIERNYSGPAVERHFGFVERTLSQRPHFAGEEFSAADIQMFYPVEAALRRAGGEWPHLRAWRERVTTRDAYRRAEARGGAAMPD
ncbi:MAG TPA: glutathione S-transferase [Polyangiaceae bacterium]|jgi:glutathione S-transferase|nr:glutathione S-transferase [Polyangiaceae bacterium]